MRLIIVSTALVAIACTTYYSIIKTTNADIKNKEFQIFAEKYESVFGEKPSLNIWNLAKKECDGGYPCTCKEG